ncbi:unnamed protein product [Prorocentrum cordatum]|uniref:Uncharacterized protein n=1 Tax=Prorocentrum cordatum TaxID=2364126 RepID=A0ABN9STN6_9DINO|nr:unnamed protein product [Polarella glacialis]
MAVLKARSVAPQAVPAHQLLRLSLGYGLAGTLIEKKGHLIEHVTEQRVESKQSLRPRSSVWRPSMLARFLVVNQEEDWHQDSHGLWFKVDPSWMVFLPAGPRVQGLDKLNINTRNPKLDIRMGRVLARKLFEAKVRIRNYQYSGKEPSRVEDLPKQCATQARKPDFKIKVWKCRCKKKNFGFRSKRMACTLPAPQPVLAQQRFKEEMKVDT